MLQLEPSWNSFAVPSKWRESSKRRKRGRDLDKARTVLVSALPPLCPQCGRCLWGGGAGGFTSPLVTVPVPCQPPVSLSLCQFTKRKHIWLEFPMWPPNLWRRKALHADRHSHLREVLFSYLMAIKCINTHFQFSSTDESTVCLLNSRYPDFLFFVPSSQWVWDVWATTTCSVER